MPETRRIAFLAPSYVTQLNAGGMVSYLLRMARALTAAGNTVELFALSDRGPAVLEHDGVRVQQVNRVCRQGRLAWLHRATKIPLLRGFRGAAEILAGAAQLAEAFETRDRQSPFDLVQSSEYCATGWYVTPRPGRVHVVRCSGARELLGAVDGGDSPSMHRSRMHYELESVRRADVAYAPSEFVADYYRRKLQRAIALVRPPLHEPVAGATVGLPPLLPPRFLLHFGQLRAYKGTLWLLDALPRAWEMAPDMQVLFVGPVRDPAVRRRFGRMLPREKRMRHLDTVSRPQMYAILREAVAAVLPSLVDNLPNTAIESLSLGIPVIGTRGASIDELVVDGRHGELLPVHDIPALARAMVRAWRGEAVARGFVWDAPIVAHMAPRQSIRALGELVNLDLG
jgi:glycosyltransferase involved in cell wall biosynthesis